MRFDRDRPSVADWLARRMPELSAERLERFRRALRSQRGSRGGNEQPVFVRVNSSKINSD
ncbi:MAG: hypothetical protein HC933_17990 [Pleurocapsa sp. SU_196_0]|nr:hypothetical protein [Pleurocapsa sp. SU_196_0]